MSRPVLVIHGGAGSHASPDRLRAIRRSLRAICEEASRYLQSHSALESVTLAVRLLEDDPLFNAGTGSMLQRDGVARMSASIMDGAQRRFAAALNVERVKNPIVVAKALLDRPDRVLAGPGATQFARALGLPRWDPVTPTRLRQWLAKHKARRIQTRNDPYGTVGAVALDLEGLLAAATSTGGKGFEQPGRVSDSGMPVGNYAGQQAAISCTGLGEDILEEGLAVRLTQRVLDGASLAQAFNKTFRELAARKRHAAAIGVDHRGRIAWRTTTAVLFAIARTSTGRLESF